METTTETPSWQWEVSWSIMWSRKGRPVAISPLLPRLTTDASATTPPNSARPVPSGQDTAGAATAARGARDPRDRRCAPAREGRLPGFVAGVPRTANGAANGAADDAMNALCGVCVATKRRFCVERACSSAAEVEIKFVLFSGGQTRPFERADYSEGVHTWRARGTMRGEASEPVVLANAAARVACGSLSMLFIFTMVAFTTLRVFGLKRVLVPRSGMIGVGVFGPSRARPTR